jgi:hypothetical protein
VLRPVIREKRFANQRRMATYQMHLSLVWPLSSGVGSAEDDQQAFDDAAELVLVRIGGFRGDKTHGGRFLSVAEDGSGVLVSFEDPIRTIPDGEFRAEVTYSADDQDFTG